MNAHNRKLNTALWIGFLLVTVTAALPYINSISYPFVYDDHGVVTENTYLRNPAHVRDIVLLRTFRDPQILDGRRPTVLLSYFADYAISGPVAAGWHITNILLHALTAGFFFLLLYRLFNAAGPRHHGIHGLCAAAAVAFAWHPVLIEPVQLPAFREDMLCGLGIMLFLLCSTPPARTLKFQHYTGAVLGLLIALGAKETGLTAPLLAAACWWLIPTLRPRIQDIKKMGGICLFAVTAYLTVTLTSTTYIQGLRGTPFSTTLSFPENLLTMPWLWMRYWALLLWPHPIAADYPLPDIPMLSMHFIIGCLFSAATLWILRVAAKQRPLLAFSLVWMLIMFLPVSNLVPLLNPMALRYAYLMVPGFVLLIALVLQAAVSRTGRTRSAPIASMLLFLIAAAWLVQTLTQKQQWQHDHTLWSHTLAVCPQSARAHLWLGVLAKENGLYDQAEEHYRKALHIDPENHRAYINLGILAGTQRDYPRSEKLLRKAISLRPQSAGAWRNLGTTLKMQGHIPEAIEAYQKAARLDPWHIPTKLECARLMIHQDRPADAAQQLTAILELQPNHPQAREMMNRFF